MDNAVFINTLQILKDNDVEANVAEPIEYILIYY